MVDYTLTRARVLIANYKFAPNTLVSILHSSPFPYACTVVIWCVTYSPTLRCLQQKQGYINKPIFFFSFSFLRKKKKNIVLPLFLFPHLVGLRARHPPATKKNQRRMPTFFLLQACYKGVPLVLLGHEFV